MQTDYYEFNKIKGHGHGGHKRVYQIMLQKDVTTAVKEEVTDMDDGVMLSNNICNSLCTKR